MRGTDRPRLRHKGIVKGRAQLSFEFLQRSCKSGLWRALPPPMLGLFQPKRMLVLDVLFGNREILVPQE